MPCSLERTTGTGEEMPHDGSSVMVGKRLSISIISTASEDGRSLRFPSTWRVSAPH